MKRKNTAAELYLNEIRFLLPIHGKYEKRFLERIARDLEEIQYDDPKCNQETFYRDLGSPQDLICNYYENTDSEYLISRLRTNRFIKRILLSILAILVVVLFMEYIHDYNAYRAVMDDQPAYYTEIIE